MCDKKCQTAFLDRGGGIRQQPHFQFQKQGNSLFCVEAARTPYLKRTATGNSKATAARIRREKSETDRLSSPTRAKREPYKYVDSFDKVAFRH